MKVSIVIPCHNAERYLAQTIGSALEQTRPPHEIIMVDDGSTDGSLAIARHFEAVCGGNIRVLSQRFGNAPRTRNLGARLATGDALMFLDADDVLGPDALEALAGALSETLSGNGEVIAVCPWYRLEQVDQRWVKRPATCAPRRGRDALTAWLTGWYHPPCSVLWSRAAFESAGRWDPLAVVNNNGDIMMRALASGAPLLEVGAGAAYYRRLPRGQTSLSGARVTPQGLASRIRTIEKIGCWLEERERRAEYLEPLRAAFLRIADDARGHHPDLCGRAELYARRYAPPLWARITRRAVRSRARRGVRLALGICESRNLPPEAPPAGPHLEIRFGLGRATQVLDVPAPPPNGSSAPIPPDPAVSVIIPTYNRARLLPRALDSVFAQTCPDFELLVVDDGSTDDTRSVIARYADPRVRYLPQKNGGVSAARNRGLREARGEFVAFLDSDDEWFSQKLALQLQRFSELPEDVGVLYGGTEDDDGRGNRNVRRPAHRGDLYSKLLLINVIHGTSGVMIRRSVVATVGFFDEMIPAIEDYEYWLRVGRFFKFDFIDEPLIRYHDPNQSERKSLNRRENLDARAWLYRKHSAEMRRVGVANAFVRESIRRALMPSHAEVAAARRIAARALFDAPSRETLGMFRRAVFPQFHRDPREEMRDSALQPRGNA